MQRALFQKAIWATLPCAALQRRIPTISTPYQRFRLHSSRSATINQNPPSLELIAASPLATQLIAHYFASSILPGDAYLLYGEVGAGKSHFSRAFIRACLRDPTAPVPSPTFLLQNIYATNSELGPNSPPVHHLDLYRLDQPQDLHRLDLENSLPSCVSLIEWAERLDTTSGYMVPEEYLALRISILSEEEKQRALEHEKNRASVDGNGNDDAVSNSEEDDDDDEDEEEEDDERWRKIEVWPKGERWRNRVEQLQQHVTARGAALDLYISN